MNYQTITTEGYMGSTGYKGCNYHLWNTEEELKGLLLQEFKKNGIKASVRRNRGGWSYSLTITLTATQNDLTEEYRGYPISTNHYRDYDSRFTEEFNKKLNLAYRIVNSFNRDGSNSMVDYFDVGFYCSFYVKVK